MKLESPAKILGTVRSSWWELLKAGWRLWPVVHIITYTVIPCQDRYHALAVLSTKGIAARCCQTSGCPDLQSLCQTSWVYGQLGQNTRLVQGALGGHGGAGVGHHSQRVWPAEEGACWGRCLRSTRRCRRRRIVHRRHPAGHDSELLTVSTFISIPRSANRMLIADSQSVHTCKFVLCRCGHCHCYLA